MGLPCCIPGQRTQDRRICTPRSVQIIPGGLGAVPRVVTKDGLEGLHRSESGRAHPSSPQMRTVP